MNEKKVYTVKNRSASMVGYSIPEMGIRREYTPGEIKKNVSYEELEKLSYQAGGREIMANFLQILSEEVLNDLGIPAEPEYFMSEADIVKLITDGSLDEFLDFLDFAPVGNKDLLKKLAVSVPLTDYDKRRALKEKTGFDVDTAIKNIEAEKAEENEGKIQPVATGRRVQSKEEKPAGRRTSGTNYKVVSKDE